MNRMRSSTTRTIFTTSTRSRHGARIYRESTRTRDNDNPDTPTYTIGSADASELVAGRTYWTLIRTTAGNTNQDQGYVYGQIGHRTPNLCDSAFCIFSDESKILVDQWDVTVPGIKVWTAS